MTYIKTNIGNHLIGLEQIRTVDRQRIIKVLGNLSEKEFQKVKAVLRETYVD